MERALITLQADYAIVGQNSIGGCFQMTPASHQVFDRLAPLQRSGPDFVGRWLFAVVTLKGIITGLKTREGQAPRLSVRQKSSETTARSTAL
jgi:hypothetical protein